VRDGRRTPDDLAAFIAAEIPKWQAMAKLAGISGE
jgi:tripartite-type tricarboxylate transporter receptor subunit TctC